MYIRPSHAPHSPIQPLSPLLLCCSGDGGVAGGQTLIIGRWICVWAPDLHGVEGISRVSLVSSAHHKSMQQ